MYSEFKAFLLKNNVVALAIGFIMGAAVGKVVTALVNDLIMPLVGMALPGEGWRTYAVTIGSGQFLIGDFIGNVVDLVILAFVVFLIAKALIKPEPTPEITNCPACLEPIARAATRCKHCTQVVGAAAAG